MTVSQTLVQFELSGRVGAEREEYTYFYIKATEKRG